MMSVDINDIFEFLEKNHFKDTPTLKNKKMYIFRVMNFNQKIIFQKFISNFWYSLRFL